MGDEEEEEERIREAGETGENVAKTATTLANGASAQKQPDGSAVGFTHKHFKWAPRFTDVYKSVEQAPPGNDGWAVKEGFTR